jgi:hypothetical protein
MVTSLSDLARAEELRCQLDAERCAAICIELKLIDSPDSGVPGEGTTP